MTNRVQGYFRLQVNIQGRKWDFSHAPCHIYTSGKQDTVESRLSKHVLFKTEDDRASSYVRCQYFCYKRNYYQCFTLVSIYLLC